MRKVQPYLCNPSFPGPHPYKKAMTQVKTWGYSGSAWPTELLNGKPNFTPLYSGNSQLLGYLIHKYSFPRSCVDSFSSTAPSDSREGSRLLEEGICHSLVILSFTQHDSSLLLALNHHASETLHSLHHIFHFRSFNSQLEGVRESMPFNPGSYLSWSWWGLGSGPFLCTMSVSTVPIFCILFLKNFLPNV